MNDKPSVIDKSIKLCNVATDAIENICNDESASWELILWHLMDLHTHCEIRLNEVGEQLGRCGIVQHEGVKPAPCPFCGNEDITIRRSYTGRFTIGCDWCYVKMDCEFFDVESAVERWNDRNSLF